MPVYGRVGPKPRTREERREWLKHRARMRWLKENEPAPPEEARFSPLMELMLKNGLDPSAFKMGKRLLTPPDPQVLRQAISRLRSQPVD